MQDTAALLARVRASNDPRLSDEEVADLENAATTSLEARGLLGMHYYHIGAYRDAARHAIAHYHASPTCETAKNAVSALVMSGQFDRALEFCEDEADHFDPIQLAEALCQIYGSIGLRDAAITEGRKALKLKDMSTEAVDRPDPVVRPIDVSRPERNVISYSLFGNGPQYLQGALRNAVVVRHLYPGWTARFYVDDSVPDNMINGLIAEGAQIRKAPNLPAGRFGTFWRFLVEDDPDVDIYIVRDVDSVPNIRERVAVEDWLASGRPYHAMRDHPVHCELILAGLWGAHRGNLEPMGKRVLKFVRDHEGRMNDRTADQIFLRSCIWPLIRRDALVHDSCFDVLGSRPFPQGFRIPSPMHVGINDHSLRNVGHMPGQVVR